MAGHPEFVWFVASHAAASAKRDESKCESPGITQTDPCHTVDDMSPALPIRRKYTIIPIGSGPYGNALATRRSDRDPEALAAGEW